MATDPTQMDVYFYFPVSSSAHDRRMLRCDSWQYIIGRQHMVQPLPGMRQNVGGEPGCLALDFGSMTEDIVLRGAIADKPQHIAGATDTTTALMRWPEIEEIWRTSWRYYVMAWTATMPCMLVFYDDLGQYFEHYVLPGKLHLTRAPARDEWQFTMTFFSVKWGWT